ncbi:MAG: anti-sigma factor family protein [Bryobacteraceae bacterium]
MRRHPYGEELALYAGGELALPRRLVLAWHLRRCPACRGEVEEFRRARQALREQANALPPGVDWPLLEAEMKANIRLGVTAGAIVGARAYRVGASGSLWKPALVVAAAFAVVLVAGHVLERSRPPRPAASPGAEVVLRATPEGLSVDWGHGDVAVFGAGRTPVATAVSWDGSARAPFLDEETGQVTIYNVAAQ